MTKMIYILLWWPSWYLLFFMHGTEGELHWVVTEKVSSYGQSLTLFCSVDNCCNKTAGWRNESMTIFIDIKKYPDDPNLKYGRTYNESGFGLIIRNLSETDVNKTYECTYEFQISSTHQYLLQEDVFQKDDPSTDEETSTTDNILTSDDPSTDEETSTTDNILTSDDPSTTDNILTSDYPSTDEETSTTDEGDNTTEIAVVIGVGLVLLILTFIGILIFCVRRRQKRTKQSDTNNSVHYSADQQQGLLSSTSTNNSVQYSADQQQELLSSTSTNNSVHYSADQQQELLPSTSTNNSVHNSAEQQQELLSPTSTNNSVQYSADQQQELLSSTSTNNSVQYSADQQQGLLSSTSTNNSVHNSADQQQELLSPTSTNNSVHNSAEQQQGLLSPTSERISTPTEKTKEDLIRRQKQGGYHPDGNEPSPTWCRCTHCREMLKEVEKVCCDQAPDDCYSRVPGFEVVLDAGAYQGAAGHDDNYNRRRAAYGEFVLQHYGHLGTGNRRVIPSCCVWKIRDKYPDRYHQYRGFVENKQHN